MGATRLSAIFPSETESKALTLAPTDQTILIWGEPGTGKEFLARFIHRQSFRAEKPFLIVEMSELPWCVAPAQALPRRRKMDPAGAQPPECHLLDATGGTLCIRHADDENPYYQGVLLSFLEHPVFHDLSGEEYELDFRIILLSDRNLREGVRERWFREDLYYRLNGFTLYLQPLRERRDEMRQIVTSLLFCSKRLAGESDSCSLDDRDLEYLCRYHWPGNLRELQSMLADVGMFGGGKKNLERWVSARLV